MVDIQQQILIEQRVTNESKSAGIAYALWFFTGSLGGHRFYLGRTGTGLAMLALLIVGVATSILGVGLALLAALGIWVLIDAFLIPGMISADRNALRDRLLAAAPRT
ncbi:TM2 domain-containing protein [Falsirhodobacter sp. alg1]|uniref:TM2 domain-containing protein n=1 Tax=Falsirhodobacter sp. alg1 TaxID=1472418 RepID=UPI0005EFCC40|nr:TM2 domain-containing protein [Falsirhodobacter sp. alg1]